jgi:hydroxymethylglutaryl-CoA lyase
MALPTKVTIHEVGPREGMQIRKSPVPTEDKIRLVDLLSECNFPEIEVTSFVSPKWVPQMADAEQVVAGITRREGTEYTGIYMNEQGLERAFSTHKLDLCGTLVASASETFSKKNMNRTIEETFADNVTRIETHRAKDIPVEDVSVMAAFGCNYQGDIEPEVVIGLIARLINLADDHSERIGLIQLADTMGWATPERTRRLVAEVQDRWPDRRINLHLHDTRGLALANAYTAMELGVDDFDAAVGGLGGCPFAGFKGASGNVATEDLVHLCHESGIETGIDLERLVDVAREAEGIVGHELPGKTMRGGTLDQFRKRAAA